MNDINFGDEVKDCVSGYRGIAITRYDYLIGCTRIGVQAPFKDDELPNVHVFDEPQLEIVVKGKVEYKGRKRVAIVELADLVEDQVSGFMGIVVGIYTFMHGVPRAGVQPLMHKGKLPEDQSFYESTLKIIKKKKIKLPERKEKKEVKKRASLPGGPAPYKNF